MDDFAADLAGLLDALGLPQAFLAGHSMGGYVCLAFARHFGERLLGLGMISSQAAPDAPERKAGRYATAEQVAAQGSSAVAGMAEKLSANPDHVPFIREMILRQKPAGVISALKAMAERPDSVPLLSTFQFPVVLVHGLADALIPPDRSRDMKDVIPSAHLVELPGVGHSPALEAPVETAGALKKLLR
jgi:pimeloyl-ACP methyl ester carboxylesterase